MKNLFSPNEQLTKKNISISLGSIILFIVTYIVVDPIFGEVIFPAILIPLAISGWFLGWRGGVLTGIFFLSLVRIIESDIIALTYIISALFIIPFAGTVGWIGEKLREAKQIATLLAQERNQLEREIHERKKTEQALLEAKEVAELANRAKSDFLSSMSHELRTPLNGILGYAQILKRSRIINDTDRKGVEIIQSSGEHLLMLINDLLDLAKIEAGKMELLPNEIHLPTFLQNVTNIISSRAEEKTLSSF